jgi:hypothetical protein
MKSAARVGGSIAMAAVMAAGIGVGTANAQNRDYYGHDYVIVDRDNRRVDIRQAALSNGYEQGFEAGQRDRRSRKRFNYRDDLGYRNGNAGWNNGWGSRQNDYRTYFRQGFVMGYNDGFNSRARNRNYARNRGGVVIDNRNSPYDPYYNYPSYGNYGGRYYSNDRGDLDRNEVAQRGAQNGYYAGYQRGLYDAQQRNKANPQGHGAYQFGFDGFDPEWGSASTYQSAYRQYFIRGYEDAYQRRNFNNQYRRRF